MVNSCGNGSSSVDDFEWMVDGTKRIGRQLNECIFCSLCCGYVMSNNLVSAGCYSLALPP
ncbi:hypothetical protein T4B_8271 [Trichinella pseudospiralis]|uniref:Uncharacterized protein n=1 Tax=Trichinella pseudospiralis TaxID=6337 RepID=A0A0V1GQJ8_TRIPS|nr:hypothetical protein T4B_8271 [Trichinella pseudospiralis]